MTNVFYSAFLDLFLIFATFFYLLTFLKKIFWDIVTSMDLSPFHESKL